MISGWYIMRDSIVSDKLFACAILYSGSPYELRHTDMPSPVTD